VRPSDSRFERDDWLAAVLDEAVTETVDARVTETVDARVTETGDESGDEAGDASGDEAGDASGDEAVSAPAGLGPREYVCDVGWVVHVAGVPCWCESATEQTVPARARPVVNSERPRPRWRVA
jgi:hypothetical protein